MIAVDLDQARVIDLYGGTAAATDGIDLVAKA